MSHPRPIPEIADTASTAQFADDVRYYLAQTPRQLPSRYLYDALGSALFEAICELPWYRITRAETRLLAAHGGAIFSALPSLGRLVELGSGNGSKLATLLAARPAAAPDLQLDLIDISATALERAAAAAGRFPRVRVTGHRTTYEAGMEEIARTDPTGRTLVLFLGSNIGNFDPPSADALLRHIRTSVRSGDALLLGLDLVKPEAELLAAYDDPLGVTASFNRNLLVRINRELDGDIDVSAFAHRAIWNAAAGRMEMHLVSTRRQRVRIGAVDLDLSFEAGETIWTESSYKYRLEDVPRLLARAGFDARRHWVDAAAGFALSLSEAR
jgi:dimethylhistidine N-methyltransferase